MQENTPTHLATLTCTHSLPCQTNQFAPAQENYTNYDKGVLAEILEPIMGKGLIPAGGCLVLACALCNRLMPDLPLFAWPAALWFCLWGRAGLFKVRASSLDQLWARV